MSSFQSAGGFTILMGFNDIDNIETFNHLVIKVTLTSGLNYEVT